MKTRPHQLELVKQFEGFERRQLNFQESMNLLRDANYLLQEIAAASRFHDAGYTLTLDSDLEPQFRAGATGIPYQNVDPLYVDAVKSHPLFSKAVDMIIKSRELR